MFGELEVELDMAFGRSERGLRARAGGGWVGTTRLVRGNDAARGEGARAARRARCEQQGGGARRRRGRVGGRARGESGSAAGACGATWVVAARLSGMRRRQCSLFAH